MTYIGLLAIIAVIWAVVSSLYSFTQYLHLKYAHPNSHNINVVKLDIFIHATFPFIYAFIFWVISILAIGLICRETTVNVYTRTVVNSNEQIVVFEEQNDDEYVVSIDGEEYVCTKIVIDDEVQSVQVHFVDCERADNFVTSFFFYEFTGFEGLYELHIPPNYLTP